MSIQLLSRRSRWYLLTPSPRRTAGAAAALLVACAAGPAGAQAPATARYLVPTGQCDGTLTAEEQLIAGAGLSSTESAGNCGSFTVAVGAGSCIDVGGDSIGVTANCVDAASLDGIDSSDFARKSQTNTFTEGQIVDVTGGQAGWQLETHNDNPGEDSVVGFRRSRGSNASPTAVQTNDVLGTVLGEAHDGSTFAETVALEWYASENWTGAGHGSVITLWATPHGTTTPARVLSSSPDGNVEIPGSLMVGTPQEPEARTHVIESTPGAEIVRWETTTTGDNPVLRTFQERTQTTNGTLTGLHQLTTDNDNAYLVEARVVGRCVGGAGCTTGQALGCIVKATVKNTGGAPGTAAIVGTATSDHCATDITGLTCTTACRLLAGASCGINENVCVAVQGATNQTITWHDTLLVQQLGS